MAHNMLQEARNKMKHTKCECGSQEMELDATTFTQICADCGTVIEHSMMMTHTSAKGASGELEKTGTVTNMRSKNINYYDEDRPSLSLTNNVHKKEAKMKGKLQWVSSQLDSDHEHLPIALDNALRIWRLCFDKKLTRGYESHQLAAILFYMACRQMQPPLPYLLLDFAAICKMNVYKLAKKFGKLCMDIPIEINSLTDPSIYIARFAASLEFGNDTEQITATACKLIDQMKKDWITTGRRPSGVCGASLLIAARLHGYKRSLTEIVNVVGLSETTIKKRVKEFLDTKIATMTVHSFHESSRQQINDNADSRKDKEQEKPPIIKETEKRLLKQERIKKVKVKIKCDPQPQNIDALMQPSVKSDKREMDASSPSESDAESPQTAAAHDGGANTEHKFDHACIENARDLVHEFEAPFIVGANSENTQHEKTGVKYHEANDLSYLDDDPQVRSMLLDNDEIAAKDQLWMVCNPDWKKVKKDMDQRAMMKEEKMKSNKRKLNECFKDDPYRYVAGKVSKRFRSDKINIDVFHKLMGTSPSPPIPIKKQEPTD